MPTFFVVLKVDAQRKTRLDFDSHDVGTNQFDTSGVRGFADCQETRENGDGRMSAKQFSKIVIIKSMAGYAISKRRIGFACPECGAKNGRGSVFLRNRCCLASDLRCVTGCA